MLGSSSGCERWRYEFCRCSVSSIESLVVS